MARTFLITVNDNLAADTLVGLFDEIKGDGIHRQMGLAFQEMGLILGAHASLDAVIARPTLYCKCPRMTKGDTEVSQKFGWYIHKTCKRPAKEVVQRFIGNRILGYNNLLERIRAERDQDAEDTTDTTTGDTSRPAEEPPPLVTSVQDDEHSVDSGGTLSDNVRPDPATHSGHTEVDSLPDTTSGSNSTQDDATQELTPEQEAARAFLMSVFGPPANTSPVEAPSTPDNPSPDQGE